MTGALALAGVSLLAVAGPASAAQISGAIKTVEITQPAGQVNVGDKMRVHATWSVTDAHQGDTFVLGLPPEAEGTPLAFALLNPAGTEVVANCVVDSAAITCTLTDYADRYSTVSGDLYFWVVAAEETGSNTLTFTSGVTQYPTPLPGTGGIGPKNDTSWPFPTEGFKDGLQGQKGDQVYLGWSVYLPGQLVVSSANDPFVVTDAPDSNLTVDRSTLKVYYVNSDQWKTSNRFGQNQFLTAETDFTSDFRANGTFTVSLDKSAVQRIVNSDKTVDWLFVIQYNAYPSDAVADGYVFGNTATAEGESWSKSVTYRGAGGDGAGSNAPRSIAVTKRVTGDDSKTGPFPFAVDCTDAHGNEIAGYPQERSISADETATFTDIPVGSTCTVTETDSGGAVVSYDNPGPISIDRMSDPVVGVTATNAFEPTETPTGTPSETPTDCATETPTDNPSQTPSGPSTQPADNPSECPSVPAADTPSTPGETPAAGTANPGQGSGLAHTGAPIASTVAIALLAIAGGLILVAGRRRASA